MNDNNIEPVEPNTGDGTTEGQQEDDYGESPRNGANGSKSLFGWFKSLFHGRNGNNLRSDLADALSEQEYGDTHFSPAERAMLHNILRLREIRVDDVMVPRAEIEAAELSTTLGDLMAQFDNCGHSRMPVYCETLDDPRGMVHIRDVLAYIQKRGKKRRRGTSGQKVPKEPKTIIDLGNVDLSRTIGELNLARPVLFVPPSMLASDLMARMQAERIQMALVIDEYGGTDGLASLEDLVEIVVGDIEDEHDDDAPMITAAGTGVYVADARTEIEDVVELIGKHFDAGEHEEEVDTVGGLLFSVLGRVPTRGEVIKAIPGFEIQVMDADPRRVKRVRIVETRPNDRRRKLQRTPEA
jgi:CBS domain containing-hemolysin-like protein